MLSGVVKAKIPKVTTTKHQKYLEPLFNACVLWV